jgi:hypothetical protein
MRVRSMPSLESIATMRRILTILAAITVLIPTTHLSAQHITVEGWIDCGKWVEARKQERAVALEHYLIGLLNGLALGSYVDFWRAGGIKLSSEQAFLWMDNYCQREPLSDPVTGAIALMKEQTGNAL